MTCIMLFLHVLTFLAGTDLNRSEWALGLDDILLEKLYQKRAKQTKERGFGEGKKLNGVIAHVSKAREEAEKLNLQDEAQREYEQEKRSFQEERKRSETKMHSEIQEFDQKQKADLAELENRQADELVDNDNK